MVTTENQDGPRSAARWRFGESELDEIALELRVAGALVEVEPKPKELLMLFLRHPGEVLTKDELVESLWAGRVVSESVLTKCVAKLRQALGDLEQTQIKTVHGYGYRFMVPVVRLASPAQPAPPPSGLKEGDQPPLRPNWHLVRRFAGARGENWLAEHAKTHEQRVFKLATDAEGLSQIKREITLQRLIRETLGQREDLVRVLDWNLEEAPYFLEVDYCSQGSLADYMNAQGVEAVSLAMRLELVAQTADALAACHSVGVLHKDLKPANVFIELDSAGKPKIRLGDFGSGRVFEPDRLHALDITRMGFTQSIAADSSTSGTWAYLAPEVVAGQPPTVQSDIYSLGVMLYQLVVGDLRRPLAPGWERDVDDELLREDIAAAADTEPARRLADAADVARRLRSLASRRVERAAQRAQADQAELLRSSLERARARRGWLLATTFVSIGAAAVIGALYLQTMNARDEARGHAAATAAVNEFLVNDMIGAANPVETSQKDRKVREVLDEAAKRVEERFRDQPLLEAQVRQSLGAAYVGNALNESGEVQLLRAVDLFDREGGTVEQRARARLELALGFQAVENTDEAAKVLDAALALDWPAASDSTTPLRLRVLKAWNERIAGRDEAALSALEALAPQAEQAFGADSLDNSDVITKLSRTRQAMSDYAGALSGFNRAIAILDKHLGPGHVRTVPLAYSAAFCLTQLERMDEAEKVALAAVETAQGAVGRDHPIALNALMTLAQIRATQGRLQDAITIDEEVLAGFEKAYGDPHNETLLAMNNLATRYSEASRRKESRALFARILDISRQMYPPGHPTILFATHNLAFDYMDTAEWSKAYELQAGMMQDMKQTWPEGHANRGSVFAAHALTLINLERRDEALAYIDDAIATFTQAFGAGHQLVKRAQARRELITRRD